MNLPKLPNLDDPCGKHFVYRDFVECSKAWQSKNLNNVPECAETYAALKKLAVLVLDPVWEFFGPINLTYGVATRHLLKEIRRDVAPKIDQHSAYETSAGGKVICKRGGAACDFVVENANSLVVAQWVVGHTSYDRLYYYGTDRPIHVSATDEPIGQCVIVRRHQDSRRVLPAVVSNKKFLALRAEKQREGK